MDNKSTRTIGLLLTEGFALMSYAAVAEPFRAANVLAGQDLYRWLNISVDGQPTRASNGASLLADQKVGSPLACDTLFVFAAGDPAAFADPTTFAWLRKMASEGVRIAGVSGGPYLLARAGLLNGRRATIHWEHQAAFVEAFPTVAVENGLYVIDGGLMTCAGGAAGLDLAIELIERDHGHDLAVKVAEWFIRTEPRSADRSQRPNLRERYGARNRRVLKALAHMEVAIEEPAGREALAKVAGVSIRHLERLFVAHLGEGVGDTYMKIRLAQADQLLRATELSVTEIGVACGFQSASHFSRAFSARFGLAPSHRRRVSQGRIAAV